MRSYRRVSAPSPARRAGRRLLVALVAAAALRRRRPARRRERSADRALHARSARSTRIRQGAAGIYVRGWAYDQDTTDPAQVHIAVDGTSGWRTRAANLSRPDVAQSHPGHGSKLGFHLSTPMRGGTHTVVRPRRRLPDARADPAAAARRSRFDFDPYRRRSTALTQTPGHLTATGWAIDPNDPTSARGIVALASTASRSRATTADRHVPGPGGTQPERRRRPRLHADVPDQPRARTRSASRSTNVGLGADTHRPVPRRAP